MTTANESTRHPTVFHHPAVPPAQPVDGRRRRYVAPRLRPLYDAVTLLETTSATPFFFNFHHPFFIADIRLVQFNHVGGRKPLLLDLVVFLFRMITGKI